MPPHQHAIPLADPGNPDGLQQAHLVRRAMRLSLAAGVFMFAGKGTAYAFTGSVAILSDAAESVVHLAAVGFAAYSLWLSRQPADRTHLYGHEKVSYFSAGFEGALIGLAGLYIVFTAVQQWLLGPVIQNLDVGALLVAAAAAGNGLLGWYLVRTGRRYQSLILRANGVHVLTDCWTSAGVVAALIAVRVSGWVWLDPFIAIVVAINILFSGAGLVRQSIAGLMDEVDAEADASIRSVLDAWSAQRDAQYHGLRHRRGGDTTWIEVHLLLPDHWSLACAHASATELEQRIAKAWAGRVVLTTHLEPLKQHAAHHPNGGEDHQNN